MRLADLRKTFEPWIKEVDDALGAYLDTKTHPASHYGIIRYHLGFLDESLAALREQFVPHRGDAEGRRRQMLSRGKRMRPILCVLIGRAIGVPPSASTKMMLAVEIMHNASLVHDDIQDSSPLRWGRPTVWSRFGISQAINAGDTLIGMVYEILLSLRSEELPPAKVIEVLDVFNAVHLRMTEGQHLDILYEGRLDISVEEYLQMISCKTAAACECITHAAALMADSDAASVESYRQFGHDFGMLYQVCDDIRSIWSDPDDTGKVALGDVILRKSTLPLLYGVERGSSQLRELLMQSVERAPRLTEREAREIRQELDALEIRRACQEHVITYRDRALEHLKATQILDAERALLETLTKMIAGAAEAE